LVLDIIIVGALGRMGAEIADVVLADNAVKLRACVEYPGHPKAGEDYGVCIGRGPLGIKLKDTIDDVDFSNAVTIDFSSPQSTRNLFQSAEVRGMKLVVGTTGLGESDLELARRVSREVPVIVSPNMSVGVNLLFSITQLVASKLKEEFDIEIIEAHHRFKKDSPSGTAKRLGEIIAKEIGLPYDQAIVNGREGISLESRTRTEIGMHAVRGGDIVGDHTVLFAGLGERIELRHMAHSRNTFARGAVTTAKWLQDKVAGFYSMKDVLGI
jgi:4-hydroxy-tetrahydrodipicolinate reductase